MFARQQVVGGFDLKPAEIKAAAALDCDMGDPAGEHDNGNQEKAVDWSADRTAKPRRRQYGGERDYDQRQGEQAFGLPGKRVQERMARAKGAVEGHEDQAMRDQRTGRGNQQDGHAPEPLRRPDKRVADRRQGHGHSASCSTYARRQPVQPACRVGGLEQARVA
jgi:hypothetical protein